MLQQNLFQNYQNNKKAYALFIATLAILISLGLWQLQKLQYKKHYIESVYQGVSQPPVDIDSLDELVEYKNVLIKGEILYDKIQFLYRRHPMGKYQDGAYLVAPIKTKKGNIYLITLGWVIKSDEYKILEEIKSQNNIEVSGLIIPAERNSILLPNNDYSRKVLFTMNVEDIEENIGVKKENSFNHKSSLDSKFFVAILHISNKLATQMLPITAEMMIKVRNDHLEYAVTWFSLAVVLCFIFSFYMKNDFKLLPRKNTNH